MNVSLICIMAIGLILAASGAQAAQITQYNQTWSDIDNGAANPWTSLGTSNYVWSTAGGNALLLVNTTVTSSSQWGINLTMEAGSGFRSSIGDKLITLSRNMTYVIGPFELARYKQSNGTLMLSSNASRGKALFVTLPR
jgi:hypothetical protein